MPSDRDKTRPIRFSLRYIVVCSSLAPLAIWAVIREHWFVFWCSLGVLLLWTYLVLPATSPHNDTKRLQFGPRDVLFWLIVIALGQAWWADHRRLTHRYSEHRLLSDEEIRRLQDGSERSRRSYYRNLPPHTRRTEGMYPEQKCDRCGVRAGDKSPDDLWYTWQGREDETGRQRESKTLCNECAAVFGVMGQDQTRSTLEKKWDAESAVLPSPPLTVAAPEDQD